MKKGLGIFLMGVFFAVSPAQAAEKIPFSSGEKFSFRIYYLGIPIGRADAEIQDMTEMEGRKVYPITVSVKSFPAIDLVYKVRDEHRSYIDAEKLYSLQYERKIQEGRTRAQETIVFDQAKRTAHYLSGPYSGRTVPISKDVQDQLSCGFWFRTLSLESNTSVHLPVHAAGKNWKMEVKLLGIEEMKHPVLGKISAIEAEPLMDFQSIFVKKGKIQGWITADERRIPFRMKVKVPVLGHVTAELTEYHPGK